MIKYHSLVAYNPHNGDDLISSILDAQSSGVEYGNDEGKNE